MRLLRFGAVLAVAAGLVTAWSFLEPTHGSAVQSSSGPVTFYVRPGGKDTAAGTSPRTAWRTLARASRAVLKPGDRLLLLGGRTYPGSLLIGAADAGLARTPVLISTYGKGRAKIVTSRSGITVVDTSGLTISHLVITGNKAKRSTTAGIQLYSNLAHRQLHHVVIERADISGFGSGIAIGGAHDGAGFRDVRIANSTLHGNLDAGLQTYGPEFQPTAPGYANRDLYIAHVKAFGNLGDPANKTSNTGSGIQLGSARHATVIDSVAYHNGGAGGSATEGPIGIWAYDSTGVALTHDVSFDNTSSNDHDGGGFGLDRETSKSVIEYSLAYHNHGPGYLLYSSPEAPAPQTGNVVRFNISYGDAVGNDNVYGGMAAGGHVDNAAFYQNTIVVTKSNPQPAVKLTGLLKNVRIFNNILVAAQGLVVQAAQSKTTSQVFLAGNDYVAASGSWLVQWGKHTQYDSLQAWRAGTGEERLLGKPTGLVRPPLFASLVTGPGSRAGFVLKRSSRLRHAGLPLARLFGILTGQVYFDGKPYSITAPDVGAR